MKTNGTTASTSNGSDNPFYLIEADTNHEPFGPGAIVNDSGSAAGFFSTDGGATWARLPAGPSSISLPQQNYSKGVQVKRVAGGSDVNSVWAFLF